MDNFGEKLHTNEQTEGGYFIGPSMAVPKSQ